MDGMRIARAARLLGLLAASVPAAAQGTSRAAGRDWPIFRGDAAQPGAAAGTLCAAPELRWSFHAAKGIVSSPVVAGGRVLFGCDDGNVYALDAHSGELRWTFQTGDVVEAPPLVNAGGVFLGSSNGFFYALD